MSDNPNSVLQDIPIENFFVWILVRKSTNPCKEAWGYATEEQAKQRIDVLKQYWQYDRFLAVPAGKTPSVEDFEK